jgi:signal transduction histidine kinase
LMLNTKAIARGERPSLVLWAVSDVTDARQAEALRVDAETLRLVDKRKDEFLGILAHELRNPLAPMRFALEIMRRADNSGAQMTRARQVLDRQVSHMVRIVDDLLDVSRITQGKVELRKERLDLAGLVAGAVELCRPGITASRHTLPVSLPDESVPLDGDAVRLTQVLVNLLNNASKFTPAGGHIWLIAENRRRSYGAEAPDGETAVETADRFRPDVVILDIGMPGMNGYTVAETLRKNPETSSVVLLALSGLGQQEDKARAAQAGFDRHFTKPVDVNALRTFLAATGDAIAD